MSCTTYTLRPEIKTKDGYKLLFLTRKDVPDPLNKGHRLYVGKEVWSALSKKKFKDSEYSKLFSKILRVFKQRKNKDKFTVEGIKFYRCADKEDDKFVL